jgi:hypothetical protein
MDAEIKTSNFFHIRECGETGNSSSLKTVTSPLSYCRIGNFDAPLFLFSYTTGYKAHIGYHHDAFAVSVCDVNSAGKCALPHRSKTVTTADD